MDHSLIQRFSARVGVGLWFWDPICFTHESPDRKAAAPTETLALLGYLSSARFSTTDLPLNSLRSFGRLCVSHPVPQG